MVHANGSRSTMLKVDHKLCMRKRSHNFIKNNNVIYHTNKTRARLRNVGNL